MSNQTTPFRVLCVVLVAVGPLAGCEGASKATSDAAVAADMAIAADMTVADDIAVAGDMTVAADLVVAADTAESPPDLALTPHRSVFYLMSGAGGEEVWELPVGTTTPSLVFSLAGSDAEVSGDSPAMQLVGNKLYFIVDNNNTSAAKVWVYDPTQAKAPDVNPKVAFSINAAGENDAPSDLAEHEGKLYFSAIVAGSPHKAFVYDPALPTSATNPKVLFDFVARRPVFVGGKMVFASSSPTLGEELFAFDLAQPADTGNPQVFDINPGAPASQPGSLSVSGTKVYFRARQELYVYDSALPGSATNPKLVITAGTDGSGADINFIGADGKVYSSGSTDYSVTGSELMIYDPAIATSATNPKTVDIVAGTTGSSPAYFSGVGNKIAMSAYTPASGYELFLFDPAAATSGTNPQLIDINPGAAESMPRYFAADGNNLYFSVEIAGSGVYMVLFDASLPIDVGTNPQSLFMGTGAIYGLTMVTYLK